MVSSALAEVAAQRAAAAASRAQQISQEQQNAAPLRRLFIASPSTTLDWSTFLCLTLSATLRNRWL